MSVPVFKIGKLLRKYFITGLVFLLPLILTIYIIVIIFKFADGLLGKYINEYLLDTIGFSIPGLGLLLTLILIFLCGIFAANFIGRKIIPSLEKLWIKLPIVRQIYLPAKQLINFIFSKDKPAFKKVVMIEYPRKGAYSVGFVTNEGFVEARQKTGKDLITVFIGGTPGPFTGYFVLVPKGEVIFLDMSIEEGLKLIISGGVLTPPSNYGKDLANKNNGSTS